MDKLEILKLLEDLFLKNQIYIRNEDDYAISNSIVTDVERLIKGEESKIEEQN